MSQNEELTFKIKKIKGQTRFFAKSKKKIGFDGTANGYGFKSKEAAYRAYEYHENKSKPKDSYWSLWGKIKSRDEYCKELKEERNDDYDEYYEDEETLFLPTRLTEVAGNENILQWKDTKDNWHSKEIKDDMHAVNSLKKLDTDNEYFNSFLL